MGGFFISTVKGAIVTVFSKRRERYLPIYIPKLKSYLQNTNQNLKIIISEQLDYETTFNFNISANVGLRAAFEVLGCDYAVLVGPDNIPFENIDYKWTGSNEIAFLMYGGYKIDKNSFYQSNGNNVFMGWGWGWQDVEFYDRLNFYKIPHDAWYTNGQSSQSKTVDLSATGDSEMLSLHKWTQGRPNISFEDVPKIISPLDAGIDFEPYQENYWYSEIIKEAHINLCRIINNMPDRERGEYYSESGYKRVDINKVLHSLDNEVNYFRYNTHDVFCDSSAFPLVELPVSKKILESSPKIKNIEYQFIDNKLIRLKFV